MIQGPSVLCESIKSFAPPHYNARQYPTGRKEMAKLTVLATDNLR